MPDAIGVGLRVFYDPVRRTAVDAGRTSRQRCPGSTVRFAIGAAYPSALTDRVALRHAIGGAPRILA